MKLQELNSEEMKEINGGSDSLISGNLLGNIAIDQLVSVEIHTKDGDRETSTKFAVGKDINLNLGGMVNQVTS